MLFASREHVDAAAELAKGRHARRLELRQEDFDPDKGGGRLDRALPNMRQGKNLRVEGKHKYEAFGPMPGQD